MPSKQDPVWAVEDERGLQLALHPTEGHARHMAQTYRTDGIEGKVVPLYRHVQPALTDDEKEAIEITIDYLNRTGCRNTQVQTTLRGLLKRLGGSHE